MNKNFKSIIVIGMVGSLLLPIGVNAKTNGNNMMSNNVSYPIAQGIYKSTNVDDNYYIGTTSEEILEEKEEYNEADKCVIEYFKKKYEELKEYFNSEDFEKLKTKGRELFIELVDFCFYNGEIKDYTLEDLSEEGKKAVNKTIDETVDLLDTYVPGFTVGLTDKYTKAKDYLSTKYDSSLDYFRKWIGEEEYNNLKEEASKTGEGMKKIFSIFKDIADDKYQEFKTK